MDSICGKSSGSECCNIVVAGDIWPVLFEDGAAIGIDFTEGDGAHSGSFESKGEAANTAK
jgi:hypothetical protein